MTGEHSLLRMGLGQAFRLQVVRTMFCSHQAIYLIALHCKIDK